MSPEVTVALETERDRLATLYCANITDPDSSRLLRRADALADIIEYGEIDWDVEEVFDAADLVWLKGIVDQL